MKIAALKFEQITESHRRASTVIGEYNIHMTHNLGTVKYSSGGQVYRSPVIERRPEESQYEFLRRLESLAYEQHRKRANVIILSLLGVDEDDL